MNCYFGNANDLHRAMRPGKTPTESEVPETTN
jgi:hypothetical protein